MKLILTALTLVVFLTGSGGYKPPVENKPEETAPEASNPAMRPQSSAPREATLSISQEHSLVL